MKPVSSTQAGGGRIDTAKCRFELLLSEHKNAVERFIYYKIPVKADAQDVLQDVLISAYQKLDTLQDEGKFKAWILKIAANKRNDYFRKRLSAAEGPLEDAYIYVPDMDKTGVTVKETVEETLHKLSGSDRLVLHLFYFRNKSQKEIASQFNIPVGTVKSRLNTARRNFKNNYPYPPVKKGEKVMSKTMFPEKMPEIKIVKSDAPISPVIFEELPSWFVIPRLGEKTSWAIYDYPQKTCTEVYTCEVAGKSQIHGIDCVEITCGRRTLYARLSGTHVQYIAERHYNGDVKVTTTFLDESFLESWGIGEDNCGREINLKPRGIAGENPDGSVTFDGSGYTDVLGVYSVTLGGKAYQTLKLVENYYDGVYLEIYVDGNGRTVLRRRYNRDDWKVGKEGHYKIPWSQHLPEDDRLYVNGELYVHWYDCMSGYVL